MPITGYGLGNSVGNSWSTCLQIAVVSLDLQREPEGRLSMSDRGVLLVTGVNGTLMARRFE